MNRRYYTLRFEHASPPYRSGMCLSNADNLLHIGQSEGCDVRLSNTSQYEDVEWAVIEKVVDEDIWKLIRTSPYREHEVRVNGSPIQYVHFLKDGDRISFEGLRLELIFETKSDGKYLSSGIDSKPPQSRGVQIWLILLTLAFLSIIGVAIINRPMTDDMINEAKRSVFLIKVDSISLIAVRGADTTIVSSCRAEISGMGFLTTDSLLVTARHCIEPWLNIPDTMQLDTTASIPTFVKMALTAETHNTLDGDGAEWRTISHCSIWKADPNLSFLFCATSADFMIDKSRDLIIETGDYDHHYVWRSISARPRRTDMMLGDIAFMKVSSFMINNPKGSIRLAKPDEMWKLCRKSGRELVILGSPEGSLGRQDIEKSNDELRRPVTFTSDGYPETVLSHNGEIVPGFSGGPVLTRCGLMGWCAIGVVSATDARNVNRCYSVPVSEIHRMKNEPQLN